MTPEEAAARENRKRKWPRPKIESRSRIFTPASIFQVPWELPVAAEETTFTSKATRLEFMRPFFFTLPSFFATSQNLLNFIGVM